MNKILPQHYPLWVVEMMRDTDDPHAPCVRLLHPIIGWKDTSQGIGDLHSNLSPMVVIGHGAIVYDPSINNPSSWFITDDRAIGRS